MPHEFEQLLAVEHRQPLARVENERDAGRVELARVLQHAVAPVGRDDAERDAAASPTWFSMRMIHRARMESGDLVVVEIGRDERLRGECARALPHVLLRQPELVKPVAYGCASSPTVAMISGLPPSSFRL